MHRLSLIIVAGLAVVLSAAVLLVGCGGSTGSPAFSLSGSHAGTVPSPSPTAGASGLSGSSSLLVVHDKGRSHTLWRLDPTTGQTVKVGDIPGKTSRAVVSPDGKSVAYLVDQGKGGPVIWLGYGPGAPKVLSLGSGGDGYVNGMTWISLTQLLVCGGPISTENASPHRSANPRFYVLTVASGQVRPFRNLRGAEPSAAPGVGRVVFVKFTNPRRYRGQPGMAGIDENLMLFDLRKGAQAEILLSQQTYRGMFRAFNSPQLSPNGKYMITTATGTDVGVSYSLRDISGFDGLVVRASCPAPCAAWDTQSTKVAFWGDGPMLDDIATFVWVYDLKTGELSRAGKLAGANFDVDGLAWSSSGDLAIGLTGVLAHNPGPGKILVAPGGDLHNVQAVGIGSLPVWVN